MPDTRSRVLDPQLEPNGWLFELPVTGGGQAETDESLQVKGHPRIFVVGDASALRDPEGKVLPATAQNLGEMMVLWRIDDAITPSFTEGVTLEGPIGHAARKLAYLIRLPTDEHKVKVGISWLAKPAVDSIATVHTIEEPAKEKKAKMIKEALLILKEKGCSGTHTIGTNTCRRNSNRYLPEKFRKMIALHLKNSASKRQAHQS